MRQETKIENEFTIIDTFNVDYEDYFEDFKEHCNDNGYVLRGEGYDMEGLYLGGKVTFSGWISEIIGEYANEFWNNLERVKKSEYNDYYVVTGCLSLWRGKRGGICETFDNLYDALCKCSTDANDIIVKCDGNKVCFDCLHHDGTNCFEIYRLTYDDYYAVKYWDDDNGDVFKFIEEHKQPITYEMLGQ